MKLQEPERVKVKLTNTIGSMLEPRTSLKLSTRDTTLSDKDIKLLEKSLDEAIKSQLAIGLGNAKESKAGALLKAKEHNKFQKDKGQALALREVFDFVQTPPKEFIRFLGKKVEFAPTTQVVSKLPEFAMVSLTKSRKGVELRLTNGVRYRANLPIIPTTAQELAKRAKKIAPEGTFHLLFMPSWQRQPEPVINRDPVLLYRVAGRYAVIAAWDSDGELIMEQLKHEKSKQD